MSCFELHYAFFTVKPQILFLLKRIQPAWSIQKVGLRSGLIDFEERVREGQDVSIVIGAYVGEGIPT